MIKEKLSKLINKRDGFQDDIDFTSNPVILDMIELMSSNVDDTIHFLDKDCTGEQFVYLSEIFDEIAEKTQSHSLIAALRRCAKKYPKETEDYNIIYFIDSAEDYIV